MHSATEAPTPPPFREATPRATRYGLRSGKGPGMSPCCCSLLLSIFSSTECTGIHPLHPLTDRRTRAWDHLPLLTIHRELADGALALAWLREDAGTLHWKGSVRVLPRCCRRPCPRMGSRAETGAAAKASKDGSGRGLEPQSPSHPAPLPACICPARARSSRVAQPFSAGRHSRPAGRGRPGRWKAGRPARRSRSHSSSGWRRWLGVVCSAL